MRVPSNHVQLLHYKLLYLLFKSFLFSFVAILILRTLPELGNTYVNRQKYSIISKNNDMAVFIRIPTKFQNINKIFIVGNFQL